MKVFSKALGQAETVVSDDVYDGFSSDGLLCMVQTLHGL